MAEKRKLNQNRKFKSVNFEKLSLFQVGSWPNVERLVSIF